MKKIAEWIRNAKEVLYLVGVVFIAAVWVVKVQAMGNSLDSIPMKIEAVVVAQVAVDRAQNEKIDKLADAVASTSTSVARLTGYLEGQRAK